MKEIILVLIGGICSTLGGCIAVWLQARFARKTRMEELRGEQQLEVYKKALSLIGQIYTNSIQKQWDDVQDFMYKNDSWLSDNQVLLPHKFVENWR